VQQSLAPREDRAESAELRNDLVVVADVVAAPRSQTLAIEPRPAAVVEVDPKLARALDNRLTVLSLLACAGPIGLPALWLSRRFSKGTKALVTIAFLLATVVFPLAMAYYWLDVALRPLVDAMSQALSKR
jgi:hypothetical protein